MGIGATTKQACENWVGGGTVPAQPAARYLALCTADPGTTGANTLAGVTRVQITGAMTGSNPVVSANAVTVTNDSGSDAAQATHGAVFSALTGGDFLFGSTLDSPVTLLDGESVDIPAGSITFDVD